MTTIVIYNGQVAVDSKVTKPTNMKKPLLDAIKLRSLDDQFNITIRGDRVTHFAGAGVMDDIYDLITTSSFNKIDLYNFYNIVNQFKFLRESTPTMFYAVSGKDAPFGVVYSRGQTKRFTKTTKHSVCVFGSGKRNEALAEKLVSEYPDLKAGDIAQMIASMDISSGGEIHTLNFLKRGSVIRKHKLDPTAKEQITTFLTGLIN